MSERFNDLSAASNDVAMVFVHGFTGDRKGTWGKIPDFLQTEPGLSGWDLFGFGYQSTRRFDILKLWSADARLEEIAIELYSTPQLSRYKRLAFVAHSMGGLVVERALVKYPDLRDRTSHVILFGTPSAGLVTATLLSVLKQQIRNMSASGEFVRDLRRDWTSLDLDAKPPFHFLAVAGEQDQFVPPESPLGPFPEPVRRVIPGNHLSMLRADSPDAPCVRMLADAFTDGAAPAGARSAARLAVEEGEFQKAIEGLWPRRSELDDSGAILLALALNRLERRDEAEAVLTRLIEERGPSSETPGILGRVYKDRWEEARKAGEEILAQGYLGKAIAAYLAGFEADWRDAYPGVNAVTLMEIQEPPGARRLEPLPVVRYSVERKIARGKADYWDYATLLDLAILGMDQDQAARVLPQALACVREPWEPETTARSLRLIREARERRGSAPAWAKDVEEVLLRRAG